MGSVHCKYCKAGPFNWQRCENGWRLVDDEKNVHHCKRTKREESEEMAMPKSRTILDVVGFGTARCRVTVKGPNSYDTERTVLATELTRPEMMAVINHVGHTVTRGTSRDDLYRWITTGNAPNGGGVIIHRDGYDNEKDNDDNDGDGAIEHQDTDKNTDKSTDKSDTTTTTVDATSAIEEAIRAIAATAVGQVTIDKDEVLRLVDTAITERLVDIQSMLPVRRITIVTHDREHALPETHHEKLPRLVSMLGAGVRNVMLIGPAGTGKSTMAEQAAAALGLEFGSISLGPTTPTSKFFGFIDANGRFNETEFYRRWKDGGLFLIDEMDNGHPGLTAELNQSLAGNTCAFACGMVPRHSTFKVVATANTYGRGGDRLFVGRNQLDSALLNRFRKLDVMPDRTMETAAAMAFSSEEHERECRDWVTYVFDVRDRVFEHKAQIVVSVRDAIDGVLELAAGATRSEVEEVFWTGIPADIRSKVQK